MSGSKKGKDFEELTDGSLDAVAGARRARHGLAEKELER